MTSVNKITWDQILILLFFWEHIIAWIEGFSIFLAVFIVVFVGSYNDYKKEDQFFKLYALDQGGKKVSIKKEFSKFSLFSY